MSLFIVKLQKIGLPPGSFCLIKQRTQRIEHSILTTMWWMVNIVECFAHFSVDGIMPASLFGYFWMPQVFLSLNASLLYVVVGGHQNDFCRAKCGRPPIVRWPPQKAFHQLGLTNLKLLVAFIFHISTFTALYLQLLALAHVTHTPHRFVRWFCGLGGFCGGKCLNELVFLFLCRR